ncbi:peptidase, M15D family, vanX D-ala-D-ala dipepti dase [Formosa agariphila KMM 3901]|uniref:D-alanyl-D-alanine dipeptidase n=1 Tax=Formosa agariphila (strain DSM 15362 / KCTC 12365 / LMG 23005 / KMM 3901 / M-2Alg 35-1) TaxID=1347342 RepID=T2KI78_FORAG|nr:M15 family metallopeptidase [Formosa agariphila]CDF78505.1 peptidase, M15D family, vanX D-ala-D-ala dipepti dase [Formosa agariphila KMM 3901]
MKFKFAFFCFLISTYAFSQLPKGFVYLTDISPTIALEMRYCTDYNFVGTPIYGYHEAVCIVTKETANALHAVQQELATQNLSLKIYDSYRPQEAVNHFIDWAKHVNDTLMKPHFYPDVNKRYLFRDGYISSKSRHSSGSTVDLTIVNADTGETLDMGSPFDFFGEPSWVAYTKLSQEQKANRMLLQRVMQKHGFRSYSKEWWHFTLRNEPFKNQYFNFPVE